MTRASPNFKTPSGFDVEFREDNTHCLHHAAQSLVCGTAHAEWPVGSTARATTQNDAAC